MKLHFTKKALADLIRLRNFIHEKNPPAADRIANKLHEDINHLITFPKMGKPVPQAPAPEFIRDLIRGDYVVRYLIKNDLITILRIWHGKEEERNI